MAEPDGMDGAVGRVFWIQGRSGVYWQNLESNDSGQAAIARLGELVETDRYDELRLIQAEISAITGATDYLHIVTVRDGQVLAPNRDESAAATAVGEAADAEAVSDPLPQLLLWPEDETDADGAGRQDPLPFQEPLSAADPPPAARQPPRKRRLADGSWEVGGWRISEDAYAALHEADRAEAARDAPEGDRPRDAAGRARLAVDADDRRTFGRATERPARRSGRLTRLMRRAGGARRGEARESGRGHIALMSGVFAGAVAAGLALAAVAPDKAARFYAAALTDVRTLMPAPDLADALAAGDVASLRRGLVAGADPNVTDAEGTPLLLRAARGGNLQAVVLLLQAGADPTQPTPDGRSVLHRAAAEGRAQALARMLDAGAPVDLAGGTYGCLTPLSAAAAYGKGRAASLLAERGASLEAQPGCPAGPMEIAAAHPHVLGRLETIRAEREAILRLATGPRPPAEEASQADAAPATEPDPESPPLPAAIESHDIVELGSDEPEPASQETTAPAEASEPSAPKETQSATAEPPPEPAPMETVEVAGLAATPARPPSGRIMADTETITQPPPPLPSVRPRVKPSPPVQIAAIDPAASAQASSAPEPSPEPHTAPAESVDLSDALAGAIERGNVARVDELIADASEARLAALTTVADDRYGAGERGLVDHAVLLGRRKIAERLIDRGLAPAPKTLHAAIANADRPELAGTVPWLLEHGTDVNARVEGLTPLMRAALAGRTDLADALIEAGADAGAATEDGRVAADFAKRAGRTELQERLLIAAEGERYRSLMLGMGWTDTMESLEDRIERCKDIGDGFTACKMAADPWVEDASVVVAQFDRRAGGRLVALQIDSRPFTDPTAAKRRFEEVVGAIEAKLPSDHGGFTNRRAPDGGGFFRALRPEINQGAYFGYWPDQDRARPVFVHLKLAGIDDARGFYRIVIGNPFRAS